MPALLRKVTVSLHLHTTLSTFKPTHVKGEKDRDRHIP
jgi:hypothetical protein